MGRNTKGGGKAKPDIATEHFYAGCDIVRQHPVFRPLWDAASIYRQKHTPFPENGLARVSAQGRIYCNPMVRARPGQWARALAHCLLHLGMNHFEVKARQDCWNAACDCVAEKFLSELKLGERPDGDTLPPGITNEEKLYLRLCEAGIAPEYAAMGTAGQYGGDMLLEDSRTERWRTTPKSWTALFAHGLSNAVRQAVQTAAMHSRGEADDGGGSGAYRSPAARAKEWFVSSYPLLGAIATSFKLVENPQVCQRLEIRIAAVSSALQEIYINPATHLSELECRFVVAHELLHVALRHDMRHQWRDAYLWNVACDYVINGWLMEMSVGTPPDGVLYDAALKGLSAEAVYDRIVTDMRTYRKLATLRGVGLGDMLPAEPHWWERGEGVTLDDFYRRALGQALSYHETTGRGFLPEGLIEEIRALSHPPIPWDVELARWFDAHFPMVEKRRSYARPSRRQSSTPDIPRPNWIANPEALDGRTFGVVLDTSGSMDRALLAAALGAIASYGAARDVPGVRVVFCDAAAYDCGYMRPEDIAGSVQVRGRGGTVLQPGIDLLARAKDFPTSAPVLIITDGYCESRLSLYGREHAYLVPAGVSLPFPPKGEVFRMRLA